MEFEAGGQYQITDAQGMSIVVECRELAYSKEKVLYTMPSYLAGYYHCTAHLRCEDVVAGLSNGCLALCAQMSGGRQDENRRPA